MELITMIAGTLIVGLLYGSVIGCFAYLFIKCL